jgi:hypothetical protein
MLVVDLSQRPITRAVALWPCTDAFFTYAVFAAGGHLGTAATSSLSKKPRTMPGPSLPEIREISNGRRPSRQNGSSPAR